MRTFVVVCLLAVACADKLGYNYHPVPHSNTGLSVNPGSLGGIGGGSGLGGLGGGSGLGGLGGGSGLGGLGGGSGLGGLGGGSGLGGIGGGSGLGGIGDGSSLGGGGGDGSLGGGRGSGSSLGPAPASEYSKEFYTFSAPENEFDEPNANQQIAGAVKKNLRVVFIKSPENKGLENAALNLAKQAGDQQTAIYVLTKQTDIGELANKLNAANSGASQKPEVHFVKYRTPQDAANAQQAIQAQYNSLGGQSHSHNGGVAPVINFASQAPVSAPSVQTPGNAYLPASVLRLVRF